MPTNPAASIGCVVPAVGRLAPVVLALVLASLTALCLPTRLEARDLHITAAIGQQVRVFGHVRFADDCGPGDVPDMAVIEAPQLGRVSTAVEDVTLTARDFGSCPSGLSAPGRVVYYTADKTGHDSFRYQMSSPGKPTTDWVVTVDIP
jgi:hypothetical protein